MPTRTVTGTCHYPDGSDWASGVIKFHLVNPFETSTEVYPQNIYSETLDANGAFSITLGVPDTGTAHYEIITPDNASYEVYLASGAATTLQSLLTIASSSVDQDAVQTVLDALLASATFTGDVQIGATDTETAELLLAAEDVDGVCWRFRTLHSDFSAPADHTDNILFVGWNMGNSGTQPSVNTRHQFGMVFEAEYWPTADSADVVSEWYTTFYNTTIGAERRPLMHTINHATGAIRHTINGNLAINDSAGTLAWQFGDGGNLTSQGKAIICDTNNVAFIRQKNAAGSGYIDIQVNSGNQWSIGAPITMYGDIWFNHSNANGPILIDRTTAANYRIYVNNGSLAVEAV